MHLDITKKFKNYHIFGFTGTPIFAVNSGSGKIMTLKTTEQAFGDQLHTYTIVDAINDKNVLPLELITLKQLIKMITLMMKKFGILIEKKYIKTQEELSLLQIIF